MRTVDIAEATGSLSEYARQIIALIERSRASYKANGGQSLDEVRHRYGLRPKTAGRRKHPQPAPVRKHR